MIIKNQYIDQLTEIFDDNNQNFVFDRRSINDRSMDKIVYVVDERPVAYVITYKGADFCQKEGYPVIIKGVNKNSIYIWHMIVRKEFSGRGIGTEMLNYIIKNNSDSDIYSCVDINNIASMKCHEKAGFRQFNTFSKEHYGKIGVYAFLCHASKK